MQTFAPVSESDSGKDGCIGILAIYHNENRVAFQMPDKAAAKSMEG
jgi:hypothetical protein